MSRSDPYPCEGCGQEITPVRLDSRGTYTRARFCGNHCRHRHNARLMREQRDKAREERNWQKAKERLTNGAVNYWLCSYLPNYQAPLKYGI